MMNLLQKSQEIGDSG